MPDCSPHPASTRRPWVLVLVSLLATTIIAIPSLAHAASDDEVHLLTPAHGERVDPGNVRFSWQPLDGYRTYKLQVAKRTDAGLIRLFSKTSSRPAVTVPITDVGRYEWRVRGLDGPDGRRPWSTWSPFLVATEADGPAAGFVPPGTPSPEQAETVSPTDGAYLTEGRIDLEWSRVNDANGYEVVVDELSFRSTGAILAEQVSAVTTVLSTELDPGIYAWSVRPLLHGQPIADWSERALFTVVTSPVPEPDPTPTPTPTNPSPAPTGSTDSIDLSELRNTDISVNYPTTPSNKLPLNDLLTIGQTDLAPKSNGSFRTRCQFSHLAYDDPIVAPGKPGASHLHMYFGNTNTNANTTDQSLLNTGGSSCQGAELNRSAYWMPALFDGAGNVRIPVDIMVYYKSHLPGKVETMPAGLKMIASSDGSNDPKIYWTCSVDRNSSKNYNDSNTIPNCNSGDYLHAVIKFPECWNGELDSADHRRHLAYPKSVDGALTCPSSHPRVLPRITYHLYWEQQGNTKAWYLASDRAGGAKAPNGSTLHADWWGGWHTKVMQLWTDNCTAGGAGCKVGWISETQYLTDFSKNNRYYGPQVLQDPRLQPDAHAVLGRSESGELFCNLLG